MPPMDRLEIAPGVSVTRHFALLLEEESAVAISDLHLGFEAAVAEQRVSIPQFPRREILERLARLLDAYEPEKLIIAGDFKHEFSKNLSDEWVEIKQVLRFVQQRTQPIIVRGNHDNFLATILGDLRMKLHDRYDLGGCTFVHGHEEVRALGTIVVGQEQPAVKLRDCRGATICVRAFFVAGRAIVLPASRAQP